MGRLWHWKALPLLPHQLHLPRTWGGKGSCFALFHAFSVVLMQHPSSAVNVKSQPGEHEKTYPAATAGFTNASQNGFIPLEFTSAAFRLIQRFTCTMYDSTTSYDKVNDHRQDLFPTRVKMMEKLPPTETALLQHVN